MKNKSSPKFGVNLKMLLPLGGKYIVLPHIEQIR